MSCGYQLKDTLKPTPSAIEHANNSARTGEGVNGDQVSRRRPSKYVTYRKGRRAARTIEQSNNRTIEQSNNRTIEQSNNRTIEQSNNYLSNLDFVNPLIASFYYFYTILIRKSDFILHKECCASLSPTLDVRLEILATPSEKETYMATAVNPQTQNKGKPDYGKPMDYAAERENASGKLMSRSKVTNFAFWMKWAGCIQEIRMSGFMVGETSSLKFRRERRYGGIALREPQTKVKPVFE